MLQDSSQGNSFIVQSQMRTFAVGEKFRYSCVYIHVFQKILLYPIQANILNVKLPLSIE